MKNKFSIPVYQVDAFTDQAFKGNPAAICLLNQEYEDEFLLNIAKEMNLSETAFIYVDDLDEISRQSKFRLRWFTPKKEVRLCGHATLASASLLFNEFKVQSEEITFKTLSGELRVRKSSEGFTMNFPEYSFREVDVPKDFLSALGLEEVEKIVYSDKLQKLLIEVKHPQKVKELNPNFSKLLETQTDVEIGLVIVTAKSEIPYDFLSRCFAPWVGIDEDPVTGSAHTLLYPYWVNKLGKKELKAYQASARGGELTLRAAQENERVEIIGKATLVMKGILLL
ncbi:MAG: PhzF family phenazine biosynthesis protein [Candidatus Heimdallarchaeaceae archaeon]